LSLVPGATDIVYLPLHTAVAAGGNGKSMFNNAHGFQSRFEHVGCSELISCRGKQLRNSTYHQLEYIFWR
jgi:hypothetical protein